MITSRTIYIRKGADIPPNWDDISNADINELYEMVLLENTEV